MSKYTPGPWTVREKQNGGKKSRVFSTAIMGGDNIHWVVTQVCGHDHKGSQKANAALIAAAPDLLEACEKTIVYLNQCPNVKAAPAREAILKALKKAEGELT